jgi:HAD superfamily hydrolase (TIGR01548 family)
MRPVVVFDMDGVLVDVADSYRETICRTVEHFTGRPITRELIQDYKNRGGWNNDWALSHKIAADLGADVPYDRVVEHFQELFLGNGSEALILRERWIARAGVLERLAQRFDLAVFTGRPRHEASLTLGRCAGGLCFDPIVCADDITRGKPAPDGLLLVARRFPDRKLWYVGDTVDDARCASAAGVPFVGIAAPGAPKHAEVVRLLKDEGAVAVLDDINQLEAVLG